MTAVNVPDPEENLAAPIHVGPVRNSRHVPGRWARPSRKAVDWPADAVPAWLACSGTGFAVGCLQSPLSAQPTGHMLNSIRATRGMAVAPHALAAQSALAVLRERGNALEAMIAAAATIPVVYPHMNSIGGDGFWLIHVPGQPVRAIDACGAAALAASREWYAERGIAKSIPFRGGVAANTVAGTISGWDLAFALSRELGGRLPLARLLADAVDYAEHGIAVTRSQAANTAAKRRELESQPGFAETFLPGGNVPAAGEVFKQPRLGRNAAPPRRQRARRLLSRRARARHRRGPGRHRQPADAGRSRAAPRAVAHPASARALAGHAVQHAAADPGPGVAADPRHPRRVADRQGRSCKRRLRAFVRRGRQAGVPRPGPPHHRSRLHDGRPAGLPRCSRGPRARGRDRPAARRRPGAPAKDLRIPSGWV